MKHPFYAIIGLIPGLILVLSGLIFWHSARSTISNLDVLRGLTPDANEIIQQAKNSVMGDGYGLAFIIAGCLLIMGGFGAAFFMRHPEIDDVMQDIRRIEMKAN